ncbi:hypothetical protein HPB50_027484 [Hyalomma asiaticum]|uniref:Uncharacterized protein n=1 Tax=Hyalomma asiaticum TaxID=266040 RepID=A0ACB7T529_HYAAI|nr:hypothetical protein HPB50_027484 [Hyalomma asiaticum]
MAKSCRSTRRCKICSEDHHHKECCPQNKAAAQLRRHDLSMEDSRDAMKPHQILTSFIRRKDSNIRGHRNHNGQENHHETHQGSQQEYNQEHNQDDLSQSFRLMHRSFKYPSDNRQKKRHVSPSDPTLRAISPKKPPLPKNRVHTVGAVELPEKVRDFLSLGPKFAAEPRKAPHELLTIVRQVARRAPEGETDRRERGVARGGLMEAQGFITEMQPLSSSHVQQPQNSPPQAQAVVSQPATTMQAATTAASQTQAVVGLCFDKRLAVLGVHGPRTC